MPWYVEMWHVNSFDLEVDSELLVNCLRDQCTLHGASNRLAEVLVAARNALDVASK